METQWERITDVHKTCYLHPKDCCALSPNITTPSQQVQNLDVFAIFEDILLFLTKSRFGSDHDVIPSPRKTSPRKTIIFCSQVHRKHRGLQWRLNKLCSEISVGFDGF